MPSTLLIHRHPQRERLTAKALRIATEMHQRLGDDPATSVSFTIGPGGTWGTLQIPREGDLAANVEAVIAAWYATHPPEACDPEPEPRCAGCTHDRGAAGCALMNRSPSDTPGGRAWLWYQSATAEACPERTEPTPETGA